MASDKNIVVKALLAKAEPSYSGSVTLAAATDGIQMADRPELKISYDFDGARAYGAATLARVGPSGRYCEGTVPIHGKGLGSAYSTASLVPNLQVFMLASGYSGSISGSAWKFTPTEPDTPQTSLELASYERGEKRSLKGVYADLKVGTDNSSPPVFTFMVKGAISTPTQVARPAITYSGSAVIPPKADALALSIGATSNMKVRGFSFELGRSITPRIDLNLNNGFAGYAPGPRAAKLTVTVEAMPLTTFDPYAAFAAATPYAVTLSIGTVANNRYFLSAPQAQLMSVDDGEDGNAALWTLVFDLPQSAPSANDDHFWAFN